MVVIFSFTVILLNKIVMGYFSLHYIFIICVYETINLSKLICDFRTVKDNLFKLHIHIRRTQIAKKAGVQPIESCFP